MAVLQAENLHKRYYLGSEPIDVLRGVDIAVEPGQWLAVVGRSGCGKSTLLHLLGGLDRPDQGSIRFEERELSGMNDRERDQWRNRQVGFVFQFYHLLPELSVLENVMLGAMIQHSMWNWASVRQTTRQRAMMLLQKLGLDHRMRHQPKQLSGGERQRAAIARALMNDPHILLADEPTGNLDRQTGQQILEVLETFHRNGQTIVMVTHDPQVAQRADRVVHLEQGKLANGG